MELYIKIKSRVFYRGNPVPRSSLKDYLINSYQNDLDSTHVVLIEVLFQGV